MSEVTPIAEPWFDQPMIGLRTILSTLRKRRWWILAVTVVIAGSCSAYAFIATPIYRATTVVSPAASNSEPGAMGSILSQLGSLAPLVGLGVGARDSATEEALAVLGSREFLERFIADHNLLPRLFPRGWDRVAQRWKVPVYRQPTLAKGVKYFNAKMLAASKDKKTGLVIVTVDWRDRNEAASWANELVARVNSEMRARAMANAAAYREYLERELASTQLVETREAINRLIESEIKQRMVASVTQEYAFRTVGRALPPDADDFISPKRRFLVALGLTGGLLLGSIGALAHAAASGRLTR
jgi:uncharacterized protein involved in exopolysaccharide biosynthesis